MAEPNLVTSGITYCLNLSERSIKKLYKQVNLQSESAFTYLSHHIQSDKHIKGISLEPDDEIKQSLFADDASYILNDNSDLFHNLIESLTLFGTTLGLKLNKSKCTVLR
ncbi:hypothetical protein DPMN_072766 [Dreissena polymorpha]|uniref:Reverse transcriptase domain-containing protein n=1 Tax=Dreissena polymorpha TaxID=45954 RepID=A0A9D4BXW6_DREPO|nr:hypothetical protein DPMN_072766 [Dreissena polymorpha]